MTSQQKLAPDRPRHQSWHQISIIGNCRGGMRSQKAQHPSTYATCIATTLRCRLEHPLPDPPEHASPHAHHLPTPPIDAPLTPAVLPTTKTADLDEIDDDLNPAPPSILTSTLSHTATPFTSPHVSSSHLGFSHLSSSQLKISGLSPPRPPVESDTPKLAAPTSSQAAPTSTPPARLNSPHLISSRFSPTGQ